jgi:hypothetical protein
VFDHDVELHDRIETIFARAMAKLPLAAGPPRDELLARMGVDVAS